MPKAMGAWAKTDRVDAILLARLVAQEHQGLRPYTPPTATQRQLDRLIRRRAKLVRIKGMLKLTMSNLNGLAPDVKAAGSRSDGDSVGAGNGATTYYRANTTTYPDLFNVSRRANRRCAPDTNRSEGCWVLAAVFEIYGSC